LITNAARLAVITINELRGLLARFR